MVDGCFETGVIKWRREKLMLLQFFGKNLKKLFSQNVFKDKDNANLRYQNIDIKIYIVWTVSKYGVISGLYFPVFGLNTGKYGPEITPYLVTFHAVIEKIFNFHQRELQERCSWPKPQKTLDQTYKSFNNNRQNLRRVGRGD